MGCPQPGERTRQQDTEDTNTRREQRHAPTTLPLSHLRLRRASRLPTSPPSPTPPTSPGPHGLSCHGMPVDLMLDQALSICMFNNSTSHQPLFTIPSTTNPPSTSPPTASNSCIPSITSRCLSQSRSRSRSTLLVACYGPRGNTITAPTSSLLHESVLGMYVGWWHDYENFR